MGTVSEVAHTPNPIKTQKVRSKLISRFPKGTEGILLPSLTLDNMN